MTSVRMSAVVEGGTCIRARRLLSLALDGEAGPAEVLLAASHIGGCERCRQFAAHVVELTQELRSIRLGRPDRGHEEPRGERA